MTPESTEPATAAAETATAGNRYYTPRDERTGPDETPADAPPARLPRHDWPGLAALVAPILRTRNETVGAEDPDFEDTGVLAMASGQHLVDALYAAGVLVFTDVSDRAHLRKSWAAMSTALFHLAERRPLDAAVMSAVPPAHQVYLMGHHARGAQLDDAWRRMLAAREDLAAILRRGTIPSPVTLGAILAELGGENPYAGGRPAITDPWWGCWTDPAAAPEAFEWERYDRTIAPDAQLDGLGDLCAFLGGSWDASNPGATSFTGMVLLLIVKAQNTPERFAAIQRVFPREVAAWRVWNAMSPSPTARELYEELVDDHEPTPRPVFQSTPPGPVYAADEDALPAMVTWRAAQLATALGAGEHAGAALVIRDNLPADLRSLVAEGARAYALPWPAGTRAVYDPINGVTVRELGADRTGMTDVEVLSRTLVVTFGPDDERFPVGTVRRLGPDDKRRGGVRWWECRHCRMGATGCVSAAAEKAECLGHEAICPDQDRIDTSIPRTAASRPRSAISPGDPDWVEGFGPVPGASLGALDNDL